MTSTEIGTKTEFHYHQAKYVDDVLVRECNACGKDLMHESHIRSVNPYAAPPAEERKP